MTHRLIVVLATSLSVALAAWESAQQARGQQKSKKGGDAWSAKAEAPEKRGMAVGEKAPLIKFRDQAGQERSLEEWLHDGSVAVVFYRSVSW